MIKTFDPVQVKSVRAEGGDSGSGTLRFDSHDGIARLTGLDLKDFITTASLPAGEVAGARIPIESLPLMPGAYQVEIHLKDMASG